MKASLILLTFLFSSFFSYSQSKYFIGVNAGINFINNNAFTPTYSGAEFNNKPSVGFPARAGVQVGDKSRVRLDLGGYKMKIDQNYNFNSPQPNDPLVPNQTKISIKAQAVNLTYDHWVGGKGKFDVFASVGLRSQFSTDIEETTTYGDGREVETEFLTNDYNRNVFGVGAGAVAKFNLTDKIGYTFSPDYTYYFGGLDKSNSHNLKRLSLSIGFEVML